MIQWLNPLYLKRISMGKLKKYQKALLEKKIHPCVYLVALSDKDGELFEIIPSLLLLQTNYPLDSLRVVGIGASKTDALTICTDILQEVYDDQHDFNIQKYFEHMQWERKS